MPNAKKTSGKGRGMLGAIITVTLLLVVAVCLLLLLPGNRRGSSSVSGNIIRPSGEVIRLKDVDSLKVVRLNAENMFPGDCETVTYYIEMTDRRVQAFRFKADIVTEGSALSDVLMIDVTVNGAENDALYSGLVKDMPASLRSLVGNDPQNNEFRISVSLDTAAGNEYQANEITLDFKWWVEDGDYVSNGPDSGDGENCCPWCFGACPWCRVLVLILVPVLVVVGGLLVNRLLSHQAKPKPQKTPKKAGAVLSPRDVGLAALFGSIGIGASWVFHKIFSREDKKDK